MLHRAQGPLLPIRAHVKGHSAVKEEAVVSDSEQLPGLWLDHGVFCSSTLTSVLLFRYSSYWCPFQKARCRDLTDIQPSVSVPHWPESRRSPEVNLT